MMRLHDNGMLRDLENYLNIIFDLQSKLMDKDFKIAMLRLELAMEKDLLESFKRCFLPAITKS